ncbi:MAG TPA: type II 3-dehydroquinate dehydratase [Deltaproteobacteria bacterium]|jgi:3-dehydroquinate dehydratase-2|nr:type II 3-dehydroquinate dehydratase [Deltaproteobacteria bacterium]MDE0908801.1 type II 3-dehydroquinate dehydratase [SAR324 cluster bacterium]HIF67852.1 type II 3-dehydroquinate dehydratase [Candidatus Lambdaproteobacteria bacterium]HIL15361.1 type II 3-dehydroquinate dehydratase [Deltaproteobacteria bacterium]|tara:strand:+ start:2261 stop:2719 length:459 start_codon:yes stop_codon:yes gene_type:complete
MNQTILLLNGPNLNLLGTREPGIYGADTLESIEERVRNLVEPEGFAVRCFQSNTEGALLDWIHANRDAGFLLINPAAFTHTSVALRDAIKGVALPFLEIHLTNVHQREPFRHHSYFSDVAVGCLVGLGVRGYELGARFAMDYLREHDDAPTR